MASVYSVATAGAKVTLTTSGSNRTFSRTPKQYFNLTMLGVLWTPTSAAPTGNILSGSNFNWYYANGSTPATVNLGGTNYSAQVYFGEAISTSAATQTLFFSSSPSSIFVDAIEFTSDALAHFTEYVWSWDYNTIVTSSNSATITFPNVAPVANSDCMYVGWAAPNNTPSGTNGTPTGFTYVATSNTDLFAYNLAYQGDTAVPVGSQSSATYFAYGAALSLQPYGYVQPINYGSF